MISHEHRFIFIHPSKTGGSSVEIALAPYCLEKVVYRGSSGHYTVIYRGLNTKHYTFKMYQSLFHQDLSKYKVVYTLRNPWERVVSGFCYQRSLGARSTIGNIESFESWMKGYRQVVKYGNFSVVEMIEGCDWINTLPIIFDDLEFNFEDIVMNFLGLPKIKLPHLLKSEHGHYREYYNEETKAIVDKLYAKDIEFFGFQF